MLKLAFKIIVLIAIPAVSSAVEFEIRGVRDGAWFRKSKTEVEIREHDSKSPPSLVITTPLESCRLDGKSCDATKPISLPVTKIAPTTHVIEAKEKGGTTTEIRILSLQAVHADFAIEGVSERDEDFVAAPETYLMVLSNTGKLRYYFQPSKPVSDFRPHDVGGRRYYSYVATERANEHVNSVGYRVILDERFQPLETLKFPMDSHEMLMLGRDHFLYSDYFKKNDGSRGCLIETAVRESRKGKITTPFSMVDFGNSLNFEPGPGRIFEGEACRPVGHLNSIQIVDHDRWLLGLGEQVVMWNHRKSKAEWIIGAYIGEFEIPAKQSFKLVHTPIWIETESRLVMFDNGHYTPPAPEIPTARVLDFKLDTKKKKVLSASAMSVAPGASEHSGGIVVTGDVMTVAFGSHGGPWDVREFKDGRPTMSIRFGGKARNYRIYRTRTIR